MGSRLVRPGLGPDVALLTLRSKPFELLFQHQPRGLLGITKETLEQQPSPFHTIKHIRSMQERIGRVMPVVREHMLEAQPTISAPGVQARRPGYCPTTTCKFLATWQGPYTVVEKVGALAYRVREPG